MITGTMRLTRCDHGAEFGKRSLGVPVVVNRLVCWSGNVCIGYSWESEHGQAVMVGASRRRERAAQVLLVRDC